MKRQLWGITFLLLLPTILLPVISWAGNNHGHRHGPPPEAIEACKDKNAGDSIVFKGPRGESIKATCRKMDGQLVAVPDNMPMDGGRPQGPPPESM